MALLCYAAKVDPFLSLDCAPTHSTLAQSKERKGSTFVIWQNCSKVRHGAENRDRNVGIVLGCLAEKMAGPRAMTIFTKDVFNYLVDNLVS